MFCLRSWIPILFFLWVTNASPIYLILFVAATYLLNRPCVYCSLLLGILVVALFDFHTAWFAPDPFTSSAPSASAPSFANGTVAETIAEALEGAVGAVVKNVSEGMMAERRSAAAAEKGGATWIGEWVRTVVARKEWRVPCLDVVVRL